jgi:hypothetical protein
MEAATGQQIQVTGNSFLGVISFHYSSQHWNHQDMQDFSAADTSYT